MTQGFVGVQSAGAWFLLDGGDRHNWIGIHCLGIHWLGIHRFMHGGLRFGTATLTLRKVLGEL